MSERIHGALAGLIIGVITISFFAFVFAAPRAISATSHQAQLPSWTSDKIRAQMGEANQVTDGSSFGFPAGVTCRLWVQQARAFILCTG